VRRLSANCTVTTLSHWGLPRWYFDGTSGSKFYECVCSILALLHQHHQLTSLVNHEAFNVIVKRAAVTKMYSVYVASSDLTAVTAFLAVRHPHYVRAHSCKVRLSCLGLQVYSRFRLSSVLGLPLSILINPFHIRKYQYICGSRAEMKHVFHTH